MQEGNLQVCVEQSSSPIVRASGELDHGNCAAFGSILTRLLDNGHGRVVLDLRELDFIDSCGIRLLIKTAMAAEESGRSLHIASMAPHLDYVLTLSGFKDIFTIGPADEQVTGVEPATSHTQCFSVPGSPHQCRRVRDEVAQFAQGMGFDALAVDDVKLAVGEAVSNAIRHGAICDGSIEVKCSRTDDLLSVNLRYPSTQFDPDSVPPPTYSSAPEGGMGIYFMRLVMDQVNYEFTDGFTSLTMHKKLADQS